MAGAPTEKGPSTSFIGPSSIDTGAAFFERRRVLCAIERAPTRSTARPMETKAGPIEIDGKLAEMDESLPMDR